MNHHNGSNSALIAWLARWLLGPPGGQRVRASQSLLVLVVYIAFAGLQHAEVVAGLVDPVESLWLTAFYLTGGVVFYTVIRSGLNQRWVSDPALTIPQMAFGFAAAAGSYAITGPARGAVMTLMVVGMVYGSFALTARQSRRMALFAFGLLSGVMAWKSVTDPDRYPPAVEAVHFGFGIIVMSAVTVLAQRMGRLRLRLRTQKADLEQALSQLRLLATRDELTGLVNRRAMRELMTAEVGRQQRSGQPMAVALLDIDLFKSINDTHGHVAGDSVLQVFAAVSRPGLRATDVLARWGGEEFLLMLPGTSVAQGLQCIERIRANLEQAPLEHVVPGFKVTFSAGISLCRPDDVLDAAIERADQAMYRAKTTGRNRTAVAAADADRDAGGETAPPFRPM